MMGGELSLSFALSSCPRVVASLTETQRLVVFPDIFVCDGALRQLAAYRCWRKGGSDIIYRYA
jgi:hypothetical protein